MRDLSKDELEDLKTWSKDTKGGPFWDTIRGMFTDGVLNLRSAAKKGESVESARFAAHIETLEEILDLPSLIIQNHAEEKGDAKV